MSENAGTIQPSYLDKVPKGMKKVVFSIDGKLYYVEGSGKQWPHFWLTVETHPPTDETQAKLKTGWVGPDFCRYTFAKTKTRCKDKHRDREEVNLVMDGKTPPVLRCKTCGVHLEDYVRAEYYFSFWKVRSYETKHLPSTDILVLDYRAALKLRSQ